MAATSRPPNTPDQQRRLRADLHRYLDTCLDQWDTIARQANEMGAGYPPNTLGGSSGSGTNTLVEAQALTKAGPGEHATQWLAEWAETRGHLTNTHNHLMRLLPMTDDEKKKAQQRENTVELCKHCELPIGGQIRRINGAPHHADTCYYQVWRAMKREAG